MRKGRKETYLGQGYKPEKPFLEHRATCAKSLKPILACLNPFLSFHMNELSEVMHSTLF